MKRVTISLDDQLYRLVKSHAQREDISLSKALVGFIRKSFQKPDPPKAVSEDQEDLGPHCFRSPVTGLVVSRGIPFTSEDVYAALEEEDEEIYQKGIAQHP